jgi:hypothetical protein
MSKAAFTRSIRDGLHPPVRSRCRRLQEMARVLQIELCPMPSSPIHNSVALE